MIPGMDYLRYTYSGAALPNTADFDTVYKKCSKSGSLRDDTGNSSGTDTSSSTEASE